jgi:hypothetical protein
MSDDPKLPPEGGEELDLGEIEDDGEGEEGDAGLAEEGAEAEGAADADGGEEGGEGDVEPPAPRQGRKSQAQRWRERAERAEREAAEGRGFQRAAEQLRQQPQQQNQEAERVARWEQDNLPMMSAQEVAGYYYNKGLQQTQQQMLMQQLQTEDRIDQRDFNQQARTSRVHAQYKDEVERELNAERQRGNLRATRDDILHRLVGRDAIDRASRTASVQRRTAARRVAGAQTRPTNGRGDGAAGRGKQSWGDPEFDARMAAEALRKGIF